MSKNAQILLENLIEQEFQNNDNYSSISDYFEFFSASQILKNQGLSDDEVDNGIVGKGLDGGCDSIYLFLNNLLITPDVVEHISAPKDSILEGSSVIIRFVASYIIKYVVYLTYQTR